MQRLLPTMRTLDVLRVTIGGVLLSAFVGTLIVVQPPLPSTPSPALDASALHGVWHVGGGPERAGTGPFSQDWFALLPTAPDQAHLSWARDGWCSKIDGSIIGREVHLFNYPTRSTFTIHDDGTATASVYNGDHIRTQRYVKHGATLPACDWLLQ